MPGRPAAARDRFSLRPGAPTHARAEPPGLAPRHRAAGGRAARPDAGRAGRPGDRERSRAVHQDAVIDPADRDQLFDLLHRHRVTLKHRFGQNFLVDHVLRDLIADAAGANEDDEVLEVGAGAGTLTIALAKKCRRLVAVELDRTMVPVLREVVGDLPTVEVVEADILRYDLPNPFHQGGEIVAGNIPYNLTGALLRKLLDPEPRPRRLSLVVQKEVAERWTASTGERLATVAVQDFAEPRYVMTIPASAFEPMPRVDSALVA